MRRLPGYVTIKTPSLYTPIPATGRDSGDADRDTCAYPLPDEVVRGLAACDRELAGVARRVGHEDHPEKARVQGGAAQAEANTLHD